MGKKAKHTLVRSLERLQCLEKNFGFVDVWVKLTVHQKKESRNSDLNTASSIDDVNKHTYLNILHHGKK